MKNSNFDKSTNIFSYWYNKIKSTGVGNLIFRAARHIRRYFFISRLIKIVTAVVAIIETSAVLIIAATGFVIMIPILLVLLAVTTIAGFSAYKKHDPTIKNVINEAEKIVFIEAKKGFFRKKSAYLNQMARCFRDDGYTVFVVSNRFRTERFLSARHVETGLWVIRLNYYYHIKKYFLQGKDDIITYIY